MSYKAGAKTPCLICDAKNQEDATLCAECNAPMALVHDALAQDRDPRIVSILGDSNAGKTVYLGFLLDMLSQRANNFEAVPKGAFSVELQQRVISYMAYRMFPPKTAIETEDWSWAYYQVRSGEANSNWVDLVMPDLAGEAIAAEVTSPHTFKVINNLMAMSGGAMLLVDAGLAGNGSPQPDFFALKMMSYLDSMFATKKKSDKIDMPIAVVLSKADYCPECFDDPRKFAQANLNRFWNMCDSRFSNVEFFTCSVVGSLAYATSEHDDVVKPVPLHTALRGILEPFEWIVQQV
jgi:hypothetical protein